MDNTVKRGRGNPGKKRPHVWICGPDEAKHRAYGPWLVMKAQAAFRNEAWDLPFEDFYAAWDGRFDQRGRSAESLSMTRRDPTGAWHRDNVMILTRAEQCRIQNNFRSENRAAKPYRKSGKVNG